MASMIPASRRRLQLGRLPRVQTQIYSPEFLLLLFSQITIAMLADGHQVYNWEYLRTLGATEIERYNDYVTIGVSFGLFLLPAIALVLGFLVYRARATRPVFSLRLDPRIMRHNLEAAAALSLGSLAVYLYAPDQILLFGVLRLLLAAAIIPIGLYSFYYLFAYKHKTDFWQPRALARICAVAAVIAVFVPFWITELSNSADQAVQVWLMVECGLCVFFNYLRVKHIHVAGMALPQVGLARRGERKTRRP